MTWFFAVIVVVVMGAIAVVASGRGGSMAEVYDDRPDARVPADRPLTSHDIRRVRFSTAFRGYRMAEVDALLDRLAAELDERQAEPKVGPRVTDDEPRPKGR
jgi:DivIVA domain-containing protein